MAEYYPLLARAVAGLGSPTPEARRAIYERAKQALLAQLRAIDPPVAEADIAREREALEAAAARLEMEQTAPSTAKPSERVPPSRNPAAAPATPRPPRPVGSTMPPRPPVQPRPVAAPRDATPAPGGPSAGPPPPPRGSAAADAPVVIATRDPPPSAMLPPAPEIEAARHAAADTSDETPESGADIIREEPVRPAAPQPVERRHTNYGYLAIGIILALIVAGVAIAAYRLRDRPEDLARQRPATTNAQPEAPAGKIAERVGGAASTESAPPPATVATPAAKSSPDAAATAPAPSAVAASDTFASATPPPAEAATAPAATAPPVAAAPAAAIPIAQRAAMLVDAPDDPQKVRTYVGTVVWRTEDVSQGQSQPLSVGVRAEVDLPEARLKMIMILRKNADATLPASHTIEVRFMPAPDSPLGGVKQIDTPQMRREDAPSGEALSGLPTTVTANYFLIGLTQGDAALARNLDLIKSRGWFDLPVLLNSGKVAKVTFEKGAGGDRVIGDALAAWQN